MRSRSVSEERRERGEKREGDFERMREILVKDLVRGKSSRCRVFLGQ